MGSIRLRKHCLAVVQFPLIFVIFSLYARMSLVMMAHKNYCIPIHYSIRTTTMTFVNNTFSESASGYLWPACLYSYTLKCDYFSVNHLQSFYHIRIWLTDRRRPFRANANSVLNNKQGTGRMKYFICAYAPQHMQMYCLFVDDHH